MTQEHLNKLMRAMIVFTIAFVVGKFIFDLFL